MRQLIAATALVALIGLPTAYFFAWDSGTVAAQRSAAGPDAAEQIIAGMHEIAAGLEESLDGDGVGNTSALAREAAADISGDDIALTFDRYESESNGLVGLAAETSVAPKPVEAEAEAVAEDEPVEDETVVAAAAPLPAVASTRVAGAPISVTITFRAPRFADTSFAGGPAALGGGVLSRAYPTAFTWFDLA